MPIFEVQCENPECKHQETIILIIKQEIKLFLQSGALIQPCPICGGILKHILSVPAKGIVK